MRLDEEIWRKLVKRVNGSSDALRGVGARSPDRAPGPTEGLLCLRRETCGRGRGHGQETVPQPGRGSPLLAEGDLRSRPGARSGHRAPTSVSADRIDFPWANVLV